MSLTLDIRYPKNAVVADVSANVEAALKKEDMGVLRCIITPILYISKETPLIKKLCKVYAEETGEYLEPWQSAAVLMRSLQEQVAFGPDSRDRAAHPSAERVCRDRQDDEILPDRSSSDV